MMISFENKMSFARKYNPTDEFICVGHFKKEYLERCLQNHEMARRRNEFMVPDYVLFENDQLPLDEQLEIINKLDHSCIRYITYSGSKSYHVLFKIKVPEDITNEEYKEIWKDVMDYYGIRDIADSNNVNTARLTRNPNGYRRKYIQDESGRITNIIPTRIKQTCIFDNPDCDELDLTENVEAIREQAAYDRAWEEKRRERLNKVFNKIARSPAEVLSHIGKECRAKEGYQMMRENNFPKAYEYMGCARGMYSVCISSGCDEAETLEYVREFLRAVSRVHPSNVSPAKANSWQPPKTY